jgi:hypothetical protein
MNSLKKRYHYYRFFLSTWKLRKSFPFYNVESLAEPIDEIRIHKKRPVIMMTGLLFILLRVLRKDTHKFQIRVRMGFL